MTIEIWKDIEGYEDLYQVSNIGRVRSLDRDVPYRCGSFRHIKGVIKKPYYNTVNGYVYVHLQKEGKDKSCSIHRLVASAFIPNPDSKAEVNHIDFDKTNNHVENLEWTSPKENTGWNKTNERLVAAEQRRIANSVEVNRVEVNQYNKNGKFIKTWWSIKLAGKTLKISPSCIAGCCRGERQTAGGYLWKRA